MSRLLVLRSCSVCAGGSWFAATPHVGGVYQLGRIGGPSWNIRAAVIIPLPERK
jgi:hypothetical protein